MNVPPALEKSGDWMVIVVTDSKGRIQAHPKQGRDQDEAFQSMENAHAASGSLWLVHWEKGFQTPADAEQRARDINGEFKSRAADNTSRFN